MASAIGDGIVSGKNRSLIAAPAAGARRDAGAARDQTHLGALDRARRVAAQRAHALDDVVHAVDVGLGEAAAVGVGRQASALPRERTARRRRAALAALAEAVVLDLHEHAAGEVVVDLRDVDVGRPDAGLGVESLRHLLAAAGGVELVGDVRVREGTEREALRRALLARRISIGRFDEIPRALLGRDDDRARPVALEAAIEQAVRVGDHRRGLVVVERHRLPAHHRARVAARVPAERHRDPAQLLGSRAVEVHVAARRQGVGGGGRSGRRASRSPSTPSSASWPGSPSASAARAPARSRRARQCRSGRTGPDTASGRRPPPRPGRSPPPSRRCRPPRSRRLRRASRPCSRSAARAGRARPRGRSPRCGRRRTRPGRRRRRSRGPRRPRRAGSPRRPGRAR